MAINPQAVRGPVTAVPVVAGTGVRLREDIDNNRVVAEADETVLCNTESNSSCTLSEAYTNFERIKIVWTYGNNLTSVEYSIVPIVSEFFSEDITATTNKNILLSVVNLNGNGSTANQFVTRSSLWKFTNANTLDLLKAYQLYNGNVTSITSMSVRRIYGINRIASN